LATETQRHRDTKTQRHRGHRDLLDRPQRHRETEATEISWIGHRDTEATEISWMGHGDTENAESPGSPAEMRGVRTAVSDGDRPAAKPRQ
jgi:hypothetical protein